MNILSLECASGACAACVLQDESVLSIAVEHMERGQDARLVPLVQEVMAKARVTFDDIDRFAVTRGPGSFTGLRIGLATARGFALASGKPVIGIDRFALFRERHKDVTGNLLIVLESKRRELFCRMFPADAPAHEPVMMAPEDIAASFGALGKIHVAGDAKVALGDALQPWAVFLESDEPEAVTCARMAAVADIRDAAYLPRPYYLRAPDVTLAAPPKPCCAAPVVEISPVEPSHARALAGIHGACFGAEAWSLDQIKGSLELPTTQGWAASIDGRLAGFIFCQVCGNEREVLTLCVHPAYRRRGIGQALVRQAQQALGSGAALFLEVAADNAAALGLYGRCGFVQAFVRKGYYVRSGGRIDAVCCRFGGQEGQETLA